MGEYEIIQLLTKKKKFMSAREIVKETNLSHASIHKSLKQMRRYNRTIEVKPFRKKCGNTKYKRKINMYRIKRR